jgi:hypothetical protein
MPRSDFTFWLWLGATGMLWMVAIVIVGSMIGDTLRRRRRILEQLHGTDQQQ